MRERLWDLRELHYHSDTLNHNETLFTIGNGYFGTRGSFEESYAHAMPSTLVHGIYDHAPNTLVPELVNVPNWIGMDIRIDGTPFQLIMKAEDILRPPHGVVLGYERVLDLKNALLRREVLFRSASGSVVRIIFERFASLSEPHVAAQRVEITAVDAPNGVQVEIDTYLDADVRNLKTPHWRDDMLLFAEHDSADFSATSLEVTTAQSGYVLGMASCVQSDHPASRIDGKRVITSVNQKLNPGAVLKLDKIISIFTSRDAVSSPLEAARAKAFDAARQGYDRLFEGHSAEWAKYWETADIRIDGDEEIQRALRFTTYHILIAAPRHEERVSVGAKTLSGLGYKGHVFWDTELFIVPPLILSHPDIARNLLMYRFHNLAGARRKATENGFEGAMYPWESTDTGEETTPQWSDPQPDGNLIRIWTGDSEQHISTDIAYAIWKYWRWTGDDEFMRLYGAEMLLDTAVFWGSRVEEKNDRYEISQQIGPDEYHENIDNSVFTNRMVVWHLDKALKTLDILQTKAPADAERLRRELNLTDERLDRWRDIVARMFIPFDDEQQIHIQFPGFFDMEYIPVPDYTPRTTSVQAILGHSRAIQSQVIKQADVVMLMALLGDEVAPREIQINNWNTYYPRTDHGSSLSPAMHAWVAARLGLDDEAYDMLHHAVHIDLHDNKGNVRDGIHAAACGGVWQAVIFGFCGLQIGSDGALITQPNLPAHWRSVSFTVYYQGEKRTFTVTNPV